MRDAATRAAKRSADPRAIDLPRLVLLFYTAAVIQGRGKAVQSAAYGQAPGAGAFRRDVRVASLRAIVPPNRAQYV